MDFEKIKEDIYFVDGSWRDIYVNKYTENDWEKWINYVNKNYKVYWNNKDKIDFEIIKNDWRENRVSETATILIKNIHINCHFFWEFENDIDPKEIKNIQDHNCIISYMKDISEIFNTEVYLSCENIRNIYLMKLCDDKLFYIE